MQSTKSDSPQREDIQDDEVIGTAVQRSLIVLATLACLGGATFLALKFLQPPPPEEHAIPLTLPEVRDTQAVELPRIPLVDITQQAGIDWQHVSGMEGEKLLPETMGGGVNLALH